MLSSVVVRVLSSVAGTGESASKVGLVAYTLNGVPMEQSILEVPHTLHELRELANLLPGTQQELSEAVQAVGFIGNTEGPKRLVKLSDTTLSSFWEQVQSDSRHVEVSVKDAIGGRFPYASEVWRNQLVDVSTEAKMCSLALMFVIFLAPRLSEEFISSLPQPVQPLAKAIQMRRAEADRKDPKQQMLDFAVANVAETEDALQDESSLRKMAMTEADCWNTATIFEADAMRKKEAVEAVLAMSQLDQEVARKIATTIEHTSTITNQDSRFHMTQEGKVSFYAYQAWVDEKECGKVEIAVIAAGASFKAAAERQEEVDEPVMEDVLINPPLRQSFYSTLTGEAAPLPRRVRQPIYDVAGKPVTRRVKTPVFNGKSSNPIEIEMLKDYLMKAASQHCLKQHAPRLMKTSRRPSMMLNQPLVVDASPTDPVASAPSFSRSAASR